MMTTTATTTWTTTTTFRVYDGFKPKKKKPKGKKIKTRKKNYAGLLMVIGMIGIYVMFNEMISVFGHARYL